MPDTPDTLWTTKPAHWPEGLHSHFTDGLTGPCVTCGAVHRWVVPVEPVGQMDVHPNGTKAIDFYAEPGRYAIVRLSDG